jgi:hypothetical protein
MSAQLVDDSADAKARASLVSDSIECAWKVMALALVAWHDIVAFHFASSALIARSLSIIVTRRHVYLRRERTREGALRRLAVRQAPKRSCQLR